ncbi:Hypothetical predicted protein [Mytilus galloprovincialis]|uniref:Histidine N-acetyltransferase C-terminal domain-containing protein n=1 Tax=Mytilus galloprovincialis TaxID=29158 RepID=A0A8B6GXL3_MYTGA|nr:Hypothetical predicted protein [Mytilus galloprovincialis]
MDSSLIRCKRVTKEDYEKVMAIFPPLEIYNGGDYLPDYFHMLIDMPNNEMYAAVIGDTFDFRFYDTHKRTLQNKYSSVIRKENPSLKSESIDEKMLGEIIASTDHKQYLFPEDEIVVDQVPYRAIKSNAPLIISKRTTVVVSDLNCPQRTLLSISNFWQAPIGMFFNFNAYGCLSENTKEHLILHFSKFLCRPMSEYILFRGISSQGTSWTFLDSAVEEFGFNRRTELYGTGVTSVRRRITSKL